MAEVLATPAQANVMNSNRILLKVNVKLVQKVKLLQCSSVGNEAYFINILFMCAEPVMSDAISVSSVCNWHDA